jgi:hypothetical protein
MSWRRSDISPTVDIATRSKYPTMTSPISNDKSLTTPAQPYTKRDGRTGTAGATADRVTPGQRAAPDVDTSVRARPNPGPAAHVTVRLDGAGARAALPALREALVGQPDAAAAAHRRLNAEDVAALLAPG